MESERAERAEAVLELALEHAWGCFALHADHRMRAVYFFLVSAAFLSAAYVTALRFAHPYAAGVIGITGGCLTICFWRLEVRIRELLKVAEAALLPLQEILAARLQIPQLKIVQAAETSQHRFSKYSTVIRTLHWIVFALSLAGAIYALRLGFKENAAPGIDL